MDKGLTVPKLGADSLAENTQIAENLSAQFVCPSPKVLDFNEKKLHWVYVVQMLYRPGQQCQKHFFLFR